MVGLLERKVAIITGAGSGMGAMACNVFAREGAQVVAVDVDAERAARTADAIVDAGGEALAVKADVASAADVRAMVTAAVARFGRLDCAYNNAGIAAYQVGADNKQTHEWSEEAFDRIHAVNLKGVWLCMKYEIEQMLKQGSPACILNTSSIAGLAGFSKASGYSSSKHGVIGLTKTAAAEYFKLGIRVNAVCPGIIATPLIENIMAMRGGTASYPDGLVGEAEDIAELAAWLCSDKAKFVNGAAVNSDGGWLAV